MRVGVSDHAVLRWLERVEGVDVRAIKRRIRKAVTRGAGLGARSVTLDGVNYSLQYHETGDAVVTTTHSHQVRGHLAEPRLEGEPEGHWDG